MRKTTRATDVMSHDRQSRRRGVRPARPAAVRRRPPPTTPGRPARLPPWRRARVSATVRRSRVARRRRRCGWHGGRVGGRAGARRHAREAAAPAPPWSAVGLRRRRPAVVVAAFESFQVWTRERDSPLLHRRRGGRGGVGGPLAPPPPPPRRAGQPRPPRATACGCAARNCAARRGAAPLSGDTDSVAASTRAASAAATDAADLLPSGVGGDGKRCHQRRKNHLLSLLRFPGATTPTNSVTAATCRPCSGWWPRMQSIRATGEAQI